MNDKSPHPIDDDRIEIVPVRPFKEADNLFARWLVKHQIERASLGSGDVRVDTIRTDNGSARRYLVRHLALASWGISSADPP